MTFRTVFQRGGRVCAVFTVQCEDHTQGGARRGAGVPRDLFIWNHAEANRKFVEVKDLREWRQTAGESESTNFFQGCQAEYTIFKYGMSISLRLTLCITQRSMSKYAAV